MSNSSNMTRRLLLHVHTRRSYDAWITPGAIVEFARARGIGMVIVTDHDSHLGSVSCAEAAGDGSVQFPLSAEYKSTAGDIICAFLQNPVKRRDPLDMIRETHDQGGLVILPHPFKGSRFSDSVFEQADVIEVFNARCSNDDNTRAADLARSLAKPGLAGADAHLCFELSLALNEFESTEAADWREVILTAPRTLVTEKTTVRAIRRSQMLKAGRRLQPVEFAKHLIRWAQASPDTTP